MRIPALLALALLAGCAGHERRDSLRRVVPPSLDTRGLKKLEIQARRHAYPGDTLRVRVLHDGKPVWTPAAQREGGAGVTVEFAGQRRETDAEGYAAFSVPELRFPQVFDVTAARPGYALYREGLLDGRPYAAPDVATVAVHMPPGAKWGLPPAVQGCLRGVTLCGAEGWGRDIDTSAIEEKLEAAGRSFTGFDDDASEEEILDTLEHAGRGDIWVFHGHGNDRDGDGVTDSLASGDDRLITVEELCERIRTSPPDVIILSGCGTAALLDRLCDCGARLIIAYDSKVWDTNAATAAEGLLEGLLDGTATIQALLDAASGTLRTATARACVRGDLGVSLATGKLSDVMRRKTTLDILDFNMFFREPDGQEYALTTVATLVDEDGLPVPGRIVSFKYNWSEGLGHDRFTVDSSRTDAGGGVTGNRARVPRRQPGVNTYARVEAVFDGDENYGPSSDSFPLIQGR